MPAKTGIAFAVVTATGGHYATVQAAEDAGELSIHVRAGQSVAGWNQNSAGVEVELGPGVTVTSGINISGNNCSLIGGPGCTIQGEIDVTTGVEAFIEFMNGGTLQNIDINTARCYVNGGGWGTVAEGNTNNQNAIDGDGSATSFICENLGAFTTVGQAADKGPVNLVGASSILRLCKVTATDSFGDIVLRGANSCGIGCISLTASVTFGVALSNAAGIKLIGSYSAAATYGAYLEVDAVGQDMVVVGNVLNGNVFIDAMLNSIVVGNRIDTTITDNGTNSTTAANDLTAF